MKPITVKDMNDYNDDILKQSVMRTIHDVESLLIFYKIKKAIVYETNNFQIIIVIEYNKWGIFNWLLKRKIKKLKKHQVAGLQYIYTKLMEVK